MTPDANDRPGLEHRLTVRVKRVGAVAVELPRVQTEGSAGLDLCAALSTSVVLEAGARALIPTGLCFEIPAGYEGQVRPRSGLALRFGVTVLNSPGTIDSDFRGEVGVVLINHGTEPFTIEPHSRIAQLVVARYAAVELELVAELSETTRGAGGYGSTGTATASDHLNR